MELRLPLEMSPGREAACRAVFGTWRFFPNDARKNCPFVLTSFTGWSSEGCPGIGFLSRGDREIGVLRNVEPPTRPRLESEVGDISLRSTAPVKISSTCAVFAEMETQEQLAWGNR